MYKFRLFVVIIVFIAVFVACSSKSQEEPDESNVENAIPIETIGGANESIIPPFEIFEPTYTPADCYFACDRNTHHITAEYDDTDSNPDGYVIDYDLIYYDYGIDKVGIYNATGKGTIAQMPFELPNDWIVVQNCIDKVFTTWSTDSARQDSIINSATRHYVCDTDLIGGIVNSMEEQYSLFDSVFVYPYPVQTMNNADVDSETFFLTSSTGASNVAFDANDDLRFVTLRCSQGGLPVGVPRENNISVSRLRYGDLYGSIKDIPDEYSLDLYSVNENLLIDFVYYNFDYFISDEGLCDVIPLEDCIANSVDGVLHRASSYANHYCRVYSAELVYIPFAINYDGNPDGVYSFEVCIVPVWALYTLYYGGGSLYQAETSVVYLNAVTGELFSRGL